MAAEHAGPTLAEVLMKQNEIIAAQTEMISELRKSQPVRQIQFHDPEYQAQLAREAREFKTPTYQNGLEANAQHCTNETLERIPRLKPGVYLHGVVEVQISGRGAVNFRYSNRSPDQRMALKDVFRDFNDLVSKIWAEMQAAKTSAA